MLRLFLESIVLGTGLAGASLLGWQLARRALKQRPRALPSGRVLRCVRPLDLGGR